MNSKEAFSIAEQARKKKDLEKEIREKVWKDKFLKKYKRTISNFEKEIKKAAKQGKYETEVQKEFKFQTNEEIDFFTKCLCDYFKELGFKIYKVDCMQCLYSTIIFFKIRWSEEENWKWTSDHYWEMFNILNSKKDI